MRLLALETTTANGGLAWWEDGAVRATWDLDAGSYSVRLFPAMLALARQAGHELSDVDGFAVANGPGSFTGVRVGLTAVKGLVEAWRKPAAAISTLAAVAQAARELPGGAGPVLAALDAARGEVYFRLVETGAARPQRGPRQAIDGLDRRESPEGLESIDALCLRLRAHPRLLLATPHPSLAAVCAARLGAGFAAARVMIVAPRLAPAVASLGASALATAGGTGDRDLALRLDANYLRRSDAEIFTAPQARP